ncbi:MAG: ethylbenzene dehydrogenase-related protein [bacterium]|nr:ethylbenzene dehydrogenase-related protein [bacterium]
MNVRNALFLFVTLALALLAPPVIRPLSAQPAQLVAIPIDQAPALNGLATEDVWKQAPVFTLSTQGVGKWGAVNKSRTPVQLQAVYTRDTLYVLTRWKDPTHSLDRQRWVFDGHTWQLDDQTPLERGGASTTYEDKLAFLWVMRSPSVVEKGTFYPTYVEQDAAAKYGYQRPEKTTPQGERLDMWHWKLVRTAFTVPAQVDDQYVDDKIDARTAPNAGRQTDPQDPAVPGGYYDNVKQFTAPDGSRVRGPRFYIPGNRNLLVLTQPMIARGWTKEITDYAELMSLPAGTKVPSVIGRPFSGHRADITAGHTWINGTYTLEISRKLNTGDIEHDVIFDDLTKPYYFGVAVFDNTQIGHAASDAFPMVFQKR